MVKRRSIISYEKLTLEQRKKLEKEFPDGFLGNLTTIKSPTGEIMDALIWETEEIIYLVKINKAAYTSSLEEEEDDEDDDFVDDEIEGEVPVGEESIEDADDDIDDTNDNDEDGDDDDGDDDNDEDDID